MAEPVDHDQRLKELLREFFADFLAFILPGWPERFDLAKMGWLPQEVFLDPPQGERRILDLVARLPRPAPAEDESEAIIVNIEVESEDRATRLRGQLTDSYRALRIRHKLPVLPLALYLKVALEGRGTDTHTESIEGLEVYRLQFPYLGLPGLEARPPRARTSWPWPCRCSCGSLTATGPG